MAESDARANQKHVINFAWPKHGCAKIVLLHAFFIRKSFIRKY